MVDLSIKKSDLRIVKALNVENVRFIAIGGIAVQYFGCREWHDVDDLDILVGANKETAQKLLRVFSQLEIRNDFDIDIVASVGKQIRIKQPPFYTDILTAKASQNFDDLYQASISVTVQQEHLRIVSRTDLIEMKRESADNLEKHSRDIDCLESII